MIKPLIAAVAAALLSGCAYTALDAGFGAMGLLEPLVNYDTNGYYSHQTGPKPPICYLKKSEWLTQATPCPPGMAAGTVYREPQR